MSRGRFATRTRITFSIACSPSGQGQSTSLDVAQCPFFSWLGKGSKSVYPERLVYVGSCTKQDFSGYQFQPCQIYLAPVLELSAKGYSGVGGLRCCGLDDQMPSVM